jgi:excisionase family DNA binding protein
MGAVTISGAVLLHCVLTHAPVWLYGAWLGLPSAGLWSGHLTGQTPLTPPRLLTSEEAAAYLGISARTLARLRDAEKIGYFLIGNRIYRYSEEHLIAYINNQYRGPLVARSIYVVRSDEAASRAVVENKAGTKSIFTPPKTRARK